ncbi:MAG TPA: 3-hydroxyacyl-CoA dehydrogenase NAD-binding domain-containing protein [Gammaproteobacteria bacterium]|jgi:3-hydroxyacyl-CoA dehydrogenase/enoyl-CoA hydratase/3-hydroxybutyryl-CoA epimerase|nr:3-hydroxyacyl-CoA dehydrogenase NAD-binding domain-containing protein [Gammaproteobacteria bacterium]
MVNHTLKHWRTETDSDNILWFIFDKQNASVNTIDREVMEEFSSLLDEVANDRTHKGIIIASGKTTGFIAGADISQFTKFKDINAATDVLLLGQQILAKLENCHLPNVAMIDGFCLGGGMELALAAHYRVAEESNKTRLGLPEVKLGIHPGWGGTVRMPKLIGALQGLNMVLSAHTVSGKVAAKLGFVDAAVPRRHLITAAKYYILNKPPRHQATYLQNLSNKKWARQIIAYFLRKKLSQKISVHHYPAPFHALDNWEWMGVEGLAPYEREAKSCGKLFFSDTCQNLVRVFFLQETLKSLGKEANFKPKHVHVIGAGTMGGDIAAWCAAQGFHVTLQDLEPKLIAPAIKRASKLYQEKFKEGFLATRAMDRLIPDITGTGIARADVIIEAVVEDLSVKQKIFKMLEEKAKPTAILATNTSSIPLDEINTVLQNPERLVGIHFFNPVAKMQLVEIVKGEKTSQTTVDQATAFVRQLDRLPLPVKSSPGFLVNRILMPYLLESVELLNEGVPAPVIDKAMTDFGMPMGPITLADTVGLDICLSVAKNLSQYYPSTTIPTQLTKMVEAKQLGRKTGQGFYKYDKAGKQVKPEFAPYHQPLQALADRLVLRMLNEAFACLREGVVASGDLLDAGMIFGTGFAPFRGGPIHYAKSQGIQTLYQQFVLQAKARGGDKLTLERWEEIA